MTNEHIQTVLLAVIAFKVWFVAHNTFHICKILSRSSLWSEK